MKNKFADLWSGENYIFYVLEGKKIWHTAEGSYEIGEGSCVLVRKGVSSRYPAERHRNPDVFFHLYVHLL